MNIRKFIVIRKAHVILLELMIAMGLTLVILSSLMFFYHQVNLINAEMDREQNESFKKLYLENRLANILPKTVSSTDPSTDFHFFTSQDMGGLFKQGMPSLVFSFDNCVQLDKQMSYHVIGRVFLDQDGNLMLAKWPVEKRWKENETPPMTKEVLLDNVENLSFSFFIPPDKAKKALTEEKQPQPTQVKLEIPQELKGRWVEVWNKEYHQLPAIVKMMMTRKDRFGKDEVLTFAFPLPNALNPVTYDE
jgi:hypothetical protein